MIRNEELVRKLLQFALWSMRQNVTKHKPHRQTKVGFLQPITLKYPRNLKTDISGLSPRKCATKINFHSTSHCHRPIFKFSGLLVEYTTTEVRKLRPSIGWRASSTRERGDSRGCAMRIQVRLLCALISRFIKHIISKGCRMDVQDTRRLETLCGRSK